MERFVQLVVAGGLTLLAGLWAIELTVTGTLPWLGGAVLVALGLLGLAVGIGRELDVSR